MTLVKKATLFIAGLGLSTALLAGTPASFTPAQTQAIQQVVHDYLLNNPSILIEVSQKLQQQQEQQVQAIQQKAKKVLPEIAGPLYNDQNSPVGGNAKGNVTIVEFFDYQCPHCKDMTPVLDKLVQQDGQIKLVYKEFPIFGADSQFAAAVALASAKQGKYEVLHEALMQTADPLTQDVVLKVASQSGLDMAELQKDVASPAIKNELDTTMQLAKKLQLMGTPSFVIANTGDTHQSILIPGTTSGDVLMTLVQQARQSTLVSK